MAGVNLHEHIETRKTKYSKKKKKKRSSGPCLSQDNEPTGLASYTVLDEWMEKAEMEIETKKMEWKMKMEDRWKTRNEGTNDNNHPYPPETYSTIGISQMKMVTKSCTGTNEMIMHDKNLVTCTEYL